MTATISYECGRTTADCLPTWPRLFPAYLRDVDDVGHGHALGSYSVKLQALRHSKAFGLSCTGVLLCLLAMGAGAPPPGLAAGAELTAGAGLIVGAELVVISGTEVLASSTTGLAPGLVVVPTASSVTRESSPVSSEATAVAATSTVASTTPAADVGGLAASSLGVASTTSTTASSSAAPVASAPSAGSIASVAPVASAGELVSPLETGAVLAGLEGRLAKARWASRCTAPVLASVGEIH